MQTLPLTILISLAASQGLHSSVTADAHGAMAARFGREYQFRLPAQWEGTFYLDDLRLVPYVAIVRPVGTPKLVTRHQTANTTPDYQVVVQTFKVVTSTGGPQTVDMLSSLCLNAGEYCKSVKGLDSKATYLLLGTPPVHGEVTFGKHQFVNPSARPTGTALHRVPATSGEVAGWMLVKTDRTVLPKASSREELVLKSLTEACQTRVPATGFDACDVMQMMERYSVRTSFAVGPQNRINLAKSDLVGTVPVDTFYQSYVIPTLRGSVDRLPSRAQVGVLQVLAGWKDQEAAAKLDAVRKALNP